MFKIFETSWANKIITVNLNDFKEGIKFAEENTCDGFQLRSAIGPNLIVPDLNLFEKLTSLKHLSLGNNINLEKCDSLDGLYLLNNIESIAVDKQNVIIDFSKFPKLKEIGLEHNKKFINIEKLKHLEILVVSKYEEKDLTKISEIQSLKTLHLYQSKTNDIKGIEKLKNLEEFNFSRNNILTNISLINSLPKLSKLHIEKCKNLSDFSFLKGNTTIQDLFVSELDSIQFVKTMPNLEKINFWDCKDGDMTPLLEAPKLRNINFYPNKKHYSHTIEQIRELIKNKR
jgi:hypothetical protein